MEEQIAQAGEEELVDGYEKSVNAQCDQLKLVVSNIKKCLEEIDKIKKLKTVSIKNKKRTQRHLSKLDEMYETHWDKELIYDKQLIQLITNLYFYTEEFFSLKGVITQPIFLMTAVDDKNGLFLRKEFKQDLMQGAEKFLSLSRSGHKMSDESYRVALRFNTKTVMEQMIDAIKDNEAEKKVAKNLYSHYEEFCKPFLTGTKE